MRHRANTIHPIRYVLPPCRGIDRPPASAAYSPSAPFPKIARPAPSCHASNPTSRFAHVSRTAGHPVDTIPAGSTTCRAASESLGVEPVIGGRRGVRDVVVVTRIDLLDL